MCEEFATLANIAAENEDQFREIVEWIRLQCKQIMGTRLSSQNSNISPPTFLLGSQSKASHDIGSGHIQDPKCSKRKGAPKKLRKKSPLELGSKKSKVLCVTLSILYFTGTYAKFKTSHCL